MEKDLSIIIPFAGEYPQVIFTIQSIAQPLLESSINFEIIAVDNYCDTLKQQADFKILSAIKALTEVILNGEAIELETFKGIHRNIPSIYDNRSGEAISACVKGNPWLKYVKFSDTLSHWQAKRKGVEESKGKILLFVDAHVIPSACAIERMFLEYTTKGDYEDKHFYSSCGTMHLPLTYKILEYHRLIYKMFIEDNCFYGYKFTGFRDSISPYEVPCMSTCGMMISRKIYDAIGGWPKSLGIYGGGENFMNYTLAVCGYKKWIYPNATLFHHGDKRDYHYVGDDMVYNRLLAHYLFGGENQLKKLINTKKFTHLARLLDKVVSNGKEQRLKIKGIQKKHIDDWAAEWV
jgi:glycosyltransferase involved in cell wall biosynthesis